ncbi:MAG: hypothetical protein L0220_32670, partial [Acidobacteria bacterium]|nr:hypothetical protein [Acidobacteriota bacterium]
EWAREVEEELNRSLESRREIETKIREESEARVSAEQARAEAEVMAARAHDKAEAEYKARIAAENSRTDSEVRGGIEHSKNFQSERIEIGPASEYLNSKEAESRAEAESRSRAANDETDRRRAETEAKIRETEDRYRKSKGISKRNEPRVSIQKRVWNMDDGDLLASYRPRFETLSMTFRDKSRQWGLLFIIFILCSLLFWLGLNIYNLMMNGEIQ